MRYQILMDSCGDLSEEMKDDKEITTIPLLIRIGKKEYPDDGTISSKELLEKIHGEKGQVGSSCPSPARFLECCDKEAEHIYILTGSSALTGSYMSGKLAAQLLRDMAKEEGRRQKICVIDSKSASAGQTFLALKIMEMEKNKNTFHTIQKEITALVHNTRTYFVLENLEMLEKSGRLTGIRAKMAEALNICPVLRSNGKGSIIKSGQARGIKKALEMMQKQILKEISAGVAGPVVISHCHCPERAFSLKLAIHDRFPDMPVRIVPTRGISTLYAGRGGIVVAYATDESV